MSPDYMRAANEKRLLRYVWQCRWVLHAPLSWNVEPGLGW